MKDVIGHEVKMGDFVLLLPNYKHRYVNECNFGLLISEKKVFIIKDRANNSGVLESTNDYLLQFPDTEIKKSIYEKLCMGYSRYCVDYAKDLGNYFELEPGDTFLLRNKTKIYVYLGKLYISIDKKDGSGTNYNLNGDIIVDEKYLLDAEMLVDGEIDLYKFFNRVVYARAFYDVVKNKTWKKKLPKFSCQQSDWMRVEGYEKNTYKLNGVELFNSTSIIDVSKFNNPDVVGEYVLKISTLDKCDILEKLD